MYISVFWPPIDTVLKALSVFSPPGMPTWRAIYFTNVFRYFLNNFFSHF